MPIWRIAAVALALAGYIAVSYVAMAHWPDRPWSVALLFGPLLAGLAVSAWVRRHLPTLLAVAGFTLLLVFVVRSGGVGVHQLYVAQHGAIHALLGWTFGITLRPGATPLITMLGERVHEHFPDAQRAYTRRLTGLWTLYFAAMVVVSLLIYAFASWTAWSFFCNILTPAFAVAFFVGEHLVRYRLHPEFERVRLATALRAYRSASPQR